MKPPRAQGSIQDDANGALEDSPPFELPDGVKVAVALPCYNEAMTIAKVVRDFRQALPGADILVFDNNSSDATAEQALSAGARVVQVPQQGKGNVVRAIFDTVSANVLVMADGDDTYPASEVGALIQPVLEGRADMVVGNRIVKLETGAMRNLHEFGNRMINRVINIVFGTMHSDILSGFRAFNRRFMESVPILATGFEVETELNLQARRVGLNVLEVPCSYRSRPEGSESKLRTFSDGRRIMRTALTIFRDHYPMQFFGLLSLLSWCIAGVAGVLRVLKIWDLTDLPNALLTGTIIIFAPMGLLLLGIGLILNSISINFREQNQLISRRKRNP
jgi:glycosyltransferase involved in cell wall biosynthesis